MNISGFFGLAGASVVGIVIALGIIFAYLCVASAIFMACYNTAIARKFGYEKLDLWESMAFMVLLSIIGALVFKSTNLLQFIKIGNVVKNLN